MADGNDLKDLSEAQLIQAYVEHAQAWEATEHIGKKNRLSDRNGKIFDELKARGVALQVLQQLSEHPDAGVRSWAQSNIKWLARPRLQVPPDPPSRRSQILWQLDNPPPRALTRDEITERLRRALPEYCDRLMDLALPAIGLWPQRLRADILATASRWGGTPLAAPDWRWPTFENKPLLFVGQINCAELRGLPAAELLPSSGLLAFFGDFDAVMASLSEIIAVYHWTDVDGLVPAVAPIEPSMVFPSCALAMRPLLDLPHPFSRAVRELNLNREQASRYFDEWVAVRLHGIPDDVERHCSFSKLLGWPALLQNDLGFFAFEFEKDPRLLLQVDHYSNGEERHEWGLAGSLYFMLPERDLRAHHYVGCEFEIQVT
jgi:uncharacterized protein YwqG